MAQTKVTTKTYDIKELVEALDPDRHKETVEYEFDAGRTKFKRRPGEWYSGAGS